LIASETPRDLNDVSAIFSGRSLVENILTRIRLPLTYNLYNLQKNRDCNYLPGADANYGHLLSIVER